MDKNIQLHIDNMGEEMKKEDVLYFHMSDEDAMKLSKVIGKSKEDFLNHYDVSYNGKVILTKKNK